MKKVGETTGPYRYDLNQIPYDYTVEVRNRFKGLDLIECLMNYGMRFVTLYRRQGSRPSHGKEMQKRKWLSGEALQIAVKRREVKGKESKLPEEISINSDMQMTPPLWQKVKNN